ncbi:hypothetical protein [Leptolyngbya sp. FACHB-261]|uniref:hypothetical protein n=1 Tax=Leptolyngbya sp. FACHB-261 TaxID=2692806 RepID=UPI001682FE28|nr:hypothetical protein [Leptolyngbya sp. FACHB-261]MBD2102539.1 hypothetical protein [Leptolyngbya sp. FACHB-261]
MASAEITSAVADVISAVAEVINTYGNACGVNEQLNETYAVEPATHSQIPAVKF